MKKIKILSAFILIVIMAYQMSACSLSPKNHFSPIQSDEQAVFEEQYTNEEPTPLIIFRGNHYIFTGDPEALSFSDSSITILMGGTYEISGKLDDGSITVRLSENDEVTLILNGADITSFDTAAITVESAKKAIIITKANSKNRLLVKKPSLPCISSSKNTVFVFEGELTTSSGVEIKS